MIIPHALYNTYTPHERNTNLRAGLEPKERNVIGKYRFSAIFRNQLFLAATETSVGNYLSDVIASCK